MIFRYHLAICFLGLLLQFFFPAEIPAQQNWRELHGGVKNTITTVVVAADGTILYGTFSDGIIQSNDGGQSWWRGRLNNMPLNPSMPLAITDIIVDKDGSEILATMRNTIFRSIDGGATWTRQVTDLYEPFRNANIAALIRLDDNRVLVGTGGYSFYRSSDMTTFERVDFNDTAGMRSMFLRTPSYIFAGTNLGVYRLHPDGSFDAAGLSGGMHHHPSVGALAITEQGELLAGTDAGFYRSTDNGTNWIGRRLDTVDITTLLVAGDGVILAGSHTGMFRSADNGTTWHRAEGGLESTWITSLALTPDGDIVAGTGEGVHISSNNGQSWRSAFTGIEISAQEPSILALDSTNVLVAWGAHTRSIHRSTNAGRTWTEIETGIPANGIYQMLAAPDGSILAGTGHGLYRSTDNGTTWGHVGLDSATPRIAVGPGGRILASSTSASTLHYSTDNGKTWRQVFDGPKFWHLGISPEGDLYAGSSQWLWRSQDDGENWDVMNTTGNWVGSLAIDRQGNIYAGTETSVSRSSDRGTTWTKLDNSPQNAIIDGLTINSFGHIYATLTYGPNAGISRSADQGETWQRIEHDYGSNTVAVPELSIDEDGYLYALVATGGYRYLMRTERALAPGIRRALSPEDSSTIAMSDPTLQWGPVAGASKYHLQLGTEGSFAQPGEGNADGILPGATPIIDDSTLDSPTLPVIGLAPGTTYHWRVRSWIDGEWDLWSPIFGFTVEGTTSVDRADGSANTSGITIGLPTPHPISGRASVEFSMERRGDVVVRLCDLYGREVARVAEGVFGAGRNSVELEVSGLVRGVYVLMIGSGSRIVLIR